MTKKEIIICFSLVRRGNPYYEDNVFESKVRYSTGMLDGSRRREFERKTFKSDLLFPLALGHGTAMAEYLARVITGRRDLVIERVLSQKKLINEGHSERLDALAIAKDGTLINYEMQNERMHGMEQRMRMYESSINLSFLAKGDDYGNLPDIHDFDCWDYRTMMSEVLRSEMKYFKTTKDGVMGYGGDIDGYINEGKERGRIETIRMFLENSLVTPEQIAEVFNITSSELDDIIESFSLQNKIID